MSSDLTFAQRIIEWQLKAGRHDLPWQNTRDPYRIWVSEIMLQQTQVDTVMRYYDRFLDRFPTVEALAEADFDTVAGYWSGLGYYARARNLHRSAQMVVEIFQGKFPTSREDLETLPGIGRSTAAAISVFSFGAKETILDGNVKRVLCRHQAINSPDTTQTTAELWAYAETLVPKVNNGIYIQGLMDLGSTVCTRTRPACLVCPIESDCQAKAEGRQTEYPVKKPAKVKPTKSTQFLMLYDEHQQKVLLERRPNKGIWGGLWCFPEIENSQHLNKSAFIEQIDHDLNIKIKSYRLLEPIRHTFTHFYLEITPILCYLLVSMQGLSQNKQQKWISVKEKDSVGIPKPVSVLFDSINTLS